MISQIERRLLEELCEDMNDLLEVRWVVANEFMDPDRSPEEVASEALLRLIEAGRVRLWRGKSPPSDGGIIPTSAAAAALHEDEQWAPGPRGPADVWVEATELGCEQLRSEATKLV